MTGNPDSPRGVCLILNGSPAELDVRGDETLLETLRDRCDTTSVRYCCGIGVCGTCTVLVDGQAVSSCLLLTRMVDGCSVVTTEGLGAVERLAVSEVQAAFVEAGAFQCSYCIPAMVLTVHAALEKAPAPSAEAVCEQLGGNLCRCGSYPQVREAVAALVAARVPRLDDEELFSG